MTIGFFLEGGWDGVFWREKEETDEMTGKRSRLKQNIRKSTVWMKCRFLQKLWNQAPASSHTYPHLSGFEPGGMLSVTFEKWQRRGRTVHLSDTPVFSLFGEMYPDGHITSINLEIAHALCRSLLEAPKTDNVDKLCATDLIHNNWNITHK